VNGSAEKGDLSILRAVVDADLGADDQRWFAPDGYAGVALCILDSIYSTGNRYSSVVRMIANYRKARQEQGGDPESDGPGDLLAAADRWRGTDGFITKTGYKWRVSTKPSAPFKAAAALGAARILDRAGLAAVADVRDALTDPLKQEESAAMNGWLGLPGQRSGLTWTYFLMLAGVPGVKAGRMVVRYVSRALGHEVGAVEAATLVSTLADSQRLSRTKLDHAIWRKESGRDVFIDGGRNPPRLNS
jgi:hypothetical protein